MTFGTVDRRDRAALVLAGLSLGRDRVGRGLGAACALQFFYESGRGKGARYPWAHVDLAKLRRDAQEFCASYNQQNFVEAIGETAATGRTVIW